MILSIGAASLLLWSIFDVTMFMPSLPNAAIDSTPSVDSVTNSARLSIRPHKIAIGRKTTTSGLSELIGFPGYRLYIPNGCVGTKRMPLVVLLHGGGRSAVQEIEKFRTLADKYGMIVLAANATQRGRWDVIGSVLSNSTTYTTRASGVLVSTFPEVDVRKIDSALKLVMRTHAIDPNRLALLGFSDGGSYALFLGRNNLDIFSRVAALSALIPFDGVGPKNAGTQFFLSAGLGEPDMVGQTLQVSRALHNNGNAVISQMDFRGHVDEVSDEDVVWRWLRDSWADPSITAQVMPAAKSSAALTDTAVRKLMTLWGPLKRLPDSLRLVAQTTHAKRLIIPIYTVWTTMLLMDIATMAADYPYVATALQRAGLTASEAEAYRAAVLAVDMAQRARIYVATDRAMARPVASGPNFGPLSPTSVLGKNMLFFEHNRLLWEELKQSGVLRAP